jgi:hypothetical protein
MEFEGWVPNATGNLSFGVIGGPLKDRVLVRQHLRTEAKRWILIAQTRVNQDRILPSWFLPTLGLGLPRGSRRLDATYTLLATSVPIGPDPEGALDGVLACLVRPRRRTSPSLGRLQDRAELASQRLAQTAQEFGRATEAQRNSLPFEAPTDADWDVLKGQFTDAAEVSCNFRLHRSGKVFLTVLRHPSGIPDDALIGLVNQLYYFLKDCVHTHYHHDVSSDGIIELARIGTIPDWRNKTVRSLYREVLELRRSTEADLLSNSLGIMAYARTFDEIFHDHDFDREGQPLNDVPKLPIYRDGIVASIQLRRESSQRESDKRHLDVQFLIGAFIATCAVLFGLYSEWPRDSVARIISESVLVTLSYYPLYYVIIVGFLAILYYSNNRHSSGRRFRLIFDPIYRTFAWVPQGVMTGLLFTIAALSVAALVFVTYITLTSPTKHPEPSKATTETIDCHQTARSPPPGGAVAWRCTLATPRQD